MPRILKNTRIKGLPPKIQLQNRDAVTGSFPSHSRIASDNRTGRYGIRYEDNKTVAFTSYVSNPLDPGFDPTVPDGTYPNYTLGPVQASNGGIVFWWPLESSAVSGSTWISADGANNGHAANFNSKDFRFSESVPGYYNSNTYSFPNVRALTLAGVVNGDLTVSTTIGDQELNLSGLHSFTISLHCKLDSIASPYNPIIWRGNQNTNSADWEILVDSAGAIQFGVFKSSNGSYRIYKTANGIFKTAGTTGTWNHVVVTLQSVGTRDKITVLLYLNSVLTATSIVADTGWGGAPAGFTDTANQIFLGAAYDINYIGGAVVAPGLYDQVIIATSIATQDDVNYLYSGAPIPGNKVPTGLNMPVGLHSSNAVFSRVNQTGSVVADKETTTDIAVTGAVRKGIGDSFVTFTPGQSMTPFRDDWNPAVDAKSVVSGATQNAFYATGSKASDVGEGFDQPLWSKTKIEIDLTPSVAHSFFLQNYVSASNSYPMAYWNKDLQKWQGIGSGNEFGTYVKGKPSDFNALCEDQCIGFGTGMNNGGRGVTDFAVGAKVSNFGFPYHVKFHATSSNCISLSDYIDVPFLLEKVVLEWSGSFKYNNTFYESVTIYNASTFFILNQRQPYGFNSPDVQQFALRDTDNIIRTLITGATIPSVYNGNSINTIRDLVTYAQVVAFSAGSLITDIDSMGKELNLFTGSSLLSGSGGEWQGRLRMSGTVKSALPNDGLDQFQIGHNDSGTSTLALINKNSTRSGLPSPGGRDFVGGLEKGQVIGTAQGFGSVDLYRLDRYSKINPYILMPTDKLVFGWQLPLANRINSAFGDPQYNGMGPELQFAAAPSKIIFYGSQIREGKEYHDTLNQLLISVAVHETVE